MSQKTQLPPLLSGNPTLMSLLKQGCSITTEDGHSLLGDPQSGYINLRYDGYAMGAYSLDANGFRNTLHDIRESQRAHTKGEIY